MNRLAFALALLLAPVSSADDSALHAEWDALLAAHVSGGAVDYAGLAAEEARLDRYLATLAAADVAALAENERLALWINAYNAYTVKAILRRWPGVKSIMETPLVWKEVAWDVGGRKWSLDQIENEILRKEFREPRIHFAIVCASKSCPDLAPEAYVAARLDAQLDRQTRAFLADRTKGLALEGGRVRVSKVFEWFAGDFGDVVEFVRRHVPEVPKGARVEYFEYDWKLNGK